MKILGREEAYHPKFIMACAQQSDGTWREFLNTMHKLLNHISPNKNSDMYHVRCTVLALTTNFLWRMYWYWHSSQPGGSEFFFEETSSHFCRHTRCKRIMGEKLSICPRTQVSKLTVMMIMRPRLCSIKENYRKDHYDKLGLTGWITLTPNNSDNCLKLCTFLTCNAFQETMTFPMVVIMLTMLIAKL